MWNICLQLIHTEYQFLFLICCSVETLKTDRFFFKRTFKGANKIIVENFISHKLKRSKDVYDNQKFTEKSM